MYSFLEIQFIFMSCRTNDELLNVLFAFLFVKADNDLTKDQCDYIQELSQETKIRLNNQCI